MLDEILARINNMTPEQRAETEKLALAATRSMVFVPQPGPQTEAYLSKADVLLFGGCVSGETEFLTPVGWKRIDDYRAGDRVAQWDNGKLTFVYPEGYTRAPCDTMLHFRHKRLSMVVTPDHRMPLYDYRGVLVVKTGEEVRRAPSRHTVPVNYTVDRPGLPFSDLLIRLAVAIHADGNLYLKKDGTAHCRISLRKERKKDRLLWLLTELGIPWKEYHNPARPTEVRYSFTSDVTTKTYSGMWWTANQRQLEIILEEISYWDGDFTGAQGGDIVFNSNRQTDIDFLQYAAHACGRVANYTQRSRGCKRLHITREGSPKSVVTLRQDAVQITEVERGMKYCFTVPSTFWLARHDGKVFVTGNSPGGGKTALGVGLALNEHHRSLVVRREFVDLDGVIHTLSNILKGDTTGLVGGNRPEYRKKDGGIIHFQGMGKDIGGKQGNPHDYIYIDEAAQLPEDMVRMLIGWLRTDRPNQRCRVVMGSNPPLDAVGDWLIGYFAPWLDPTHPNPAKEGELRYFLPKPDGSGDRECAADEYMLVDGVRLAPQSRTFISSKYTDNKFYREEDYVKSLAGLPPSVRDRLMSGNFLLARPDDEFQVIPTDWVRKAQNRWTPTPPDGVPQCAIGVDVAQGGKDRTVLAIRYDGWYAPLKIYPGVETPDGTTAAGVVISHRRNTSLVIVDIGGGWGGDCYAHLKANDIDCRSFMGVKQSERRTRDNLLRFFNVRAEAYWRFREALDPAQDGGSRIALPHDPELLADLTTPRFEVTSSGIKITPKDKVVEILGRSPDKGDAVVMAWWDGLRQDNVAGGFQPMRKQVPKVVMGHASARRRR